MANGMRQTRKGFSLIELIVVIGLMALLGTISIGGYFAAARGMTARGVVQDTVSIIRQTMQTCLIDQTPTAILFCNRRQNTAAEGGEAQGIAIAIKMAGRISYIVGSGRCKTSTGDSLPVSGGMLVDEFADWNQSYPLDASDSGEQRAIRLYQMSSPNGDRLDQGVKQCSSLMCAWVGYTRLQTEYMINARRTVEDWCNDNDKTDTDNKTYSSITYDNGNDQRWGLPIHPRNTGLGLNDWHIGDAYGVEIARLELPKGYIFGSAVPTGVELTPASGTSVEVFRPNDLSNPRDYRFSFGSLRITRLDDVEGKSKSVAGTIKSDMLKDQD